MDIQDAIGRLQDRADELSQQSDAKIALIEETSGEAGPDEQKAIRTSAECDLRIAMELHALAAELKPD